MYKTPQQWVKEYGISPLPTNSEWQDAQKWLDEKYSNKEKIEEIRHTNYEEGHLIGELIIKDFPQVKKIWLVCSGIISKLEIINCPLLEELECGGNNLLVELDLREFNKLSSVSVSDNRLELIKLPNETEKLDSLTVCNNNFPDQDLSFLTPYKNLRVIDIGNKYEKRITQKGKEIFNRFHGSLDFLKNMSRLELLYIDSTDIDSGLESLPLEKLWMFSCSFERKSDAKVKKIYDVCGTSDIFGRKFDREKIKKHKADLQKNVQQKTQSVASVSKVSINPKRLEQLQKEHSFYKNFFDNYLAKKKSELDELKNRLTTEEKESLNTYLRNYGDSSTKKQLNKTKKILLRKLTNEEIQSLVDEQKEINQLEDQLNNLQVQETKIEFLPK